MLTTIEGVYRNGKIEFSKTPVMCVMAPPLL